MPVTEWWRSISAAPERTCSIMITPKELVGLLPPAFESDYIDGAVVPYLLSSQSIGERPVLPLIDLALSKENAAPPHFWGMLYNGWAPNPEEEGVTVFI